LTLIKGRIAMRGGAEGLVVNCLALLTREPEIFKLTVR
jgi:hypothetical protein